MSKAVVIGGHEFHWFVGKLYITRESDGTQLVLDEITVWALIDYLGHVEEGEKPIEEDTIHTDKPWLPIQPGEEF